MQAGESCGRLQTWRAAQEEGDDLCEALVLTTGCAMIDRMSGVADTKALQEIGVATKATIVQIWDTGSQPGPLPPQPWKLG